MEFKPRSLCDSKPHRKLTGINIGHVKVNPAEIGGGFGGKTIVYLEPLAVTLSRKSGRPVRMRMTREEVFRGSGPTSGASMDIRIGVKKDGTITAGEAILRYQAGAFPGSPVTNGCMCSFAPYNIEHQRTVGATSFVTVPSLPPTVHRVRPFLRSRLKARSTLAPQKPSAWTQRSFALRTLRSLELR